jgi:lysophospholipase L1-like esterase
MIKKFIFICTFTAMLLIFAASASAFTLNDGETLKFDFGAESYSDYIQVSSSKEYNSDDGYGFDSISFVKNSTASGEGVCSDSVIFENINGHSSTFAVDIPNGLYNLKLIAGDIDTINVTAEGYFALMNMMFNGCISEVEIPVEDGQLNISVSSWKNGVPCALSALEITRVSSLDKRRTRVFIGGDSLAATYYPLDMPSPLEPGYQGGWGQMLPLCIPNDLYVMNYASGGQTAYGFLNSGQFDAVEHYMQSGDYFIISFGVNDAVDSDEETFKNSLKEMVTRTKAKGGIPIIMTPAGKLSDFDENGICYVPDRWFKNTALSVCEELNCNYVDLHKLSAVYFTAIGEEDTKKLYWINWSGEQDFLHTSREGAGQIARLITEELIRQGMWRFDSVLSNYGVSKDVTLKCSGVYSGNKLTLQNLRPSEKNIKILVNTYNQYGVLTGTSIKNETLPPYDVLHQQETVTITLNENSLNCKAYLISGSNIISLNDTPQTRIFSTVYDKASELFDERI